MEIVSTENSRVIYLTNVHRPRGMPFGPDLAMRMVTRYAFSKFPSVADVDKDVHQFAVGKFNDIQIDALDVYSDGVIASSKSDTIHIDAFLVDLFEWLRTEMGIVETVAAKKEYHYESFLVVKSKRDLMATLGPSKSVTDTFNTVFSQSDYISSPFAATGFALEPGPEVNPFSRRPLRFLLERRVGFPPEQNIYYSCAPLRTIDHLDLLTRLEALAR